MADPVVVPCPADVWTLVATNQTTGVIHVLDTSPGLYLQTYRDTGNPAPTTKAGAVPFEKVLQISASAGIDVYVQPVGKAGSVRASL